MLTPWGESLDPDHVLSEYPRPQLVRDSYLNLNGWWRYAITETAQEPEEYDGDILVPFSPEAELSGVGRQLQPHQTLWYRRELTLPEGFLPSPDHRVLLHFGAVDQTCRVLLDGSVLGSNVGGYLPFTCDLTEALRSGHNELVVEVRDLSETSYHARGKQRLDRGGIWYTAQSGIWQTVWLESVPALHVSGLRLVPHLADAAVEVTIETNDSDRSPGVEAIVEISADGETVAVSTLPVDRPARIPLPSARAWTPEDPFLYDVRVRLGDDTVRSYFGMRSFSVEQDDTGHTRLFLNGRPYFHAGVLDQGYWSDGMYTPPSDAAMVHDIATMRRLGFTMLRKHIKIEPLRWYYHCDRLGMLVWQDLVNGGGAYRHRVVATPGWRTWVRLPDNLRRLFGRASPEGRAEFLDELRRTVDLLRNVVSLAVWVPFNEGWGQFDARRTAAELRDLDPTRTIDHASGWHDQGGGDLLSLHVYSRPFRAKSDWARWLGRRRALALTEYGGYDLQVPGHTWGETDWSYRHFDAADELAEAFERLHEDEILPAIAEGLSATCYTQVSDVEGETNGLMTYDRRVLKLPEERVRPVLEKLRAEL